MIRIELYISNRLEICQKIYTTGVFGQKFYTLKVRKLQLILLKRKQRKCKGLGRGLIGRTKEGLEVALNSLLPPGPAPSNMSNLHRPRFTFSFWVKKVNVKKENVSKNKKVKVGGHFQYRQNKS